MPTIGIDCHITLQHPDVNGGVAYGFIVRPNSDNEAVITLHREAYLDEASAAQDVTHLIAIILVTDNATNPNGSKRTTTRAQDYTNLIEILSKHSGITIGLPIGLLVDYYTIGQVTIERLKQSQDEIEIHLSSQNQYILPADTGLYANSFWVDETTYTGSMSWSNSFWRLT